MRLLLSKGHSCYRPRRTGERKRKSVRGCIVGLDLSVLSVVIVKQGDAELPGLTDTTQPKRLGPKRASKIRKFFGLTKEDDVRKFVIRREVQPKNPEKKPYTKAPKIQRLGRISSSFPPFSLRQVILQAPCVVVFFVRLSESY